MSSMTLHCRIATTFSRDGAFDQDAFRAFLQRFIDSNIGVYLAASPLEGYTLTTDELRRVYRAGVETCKGRVFVGANGPEAHTARDTITMCQLGVEANVDHVNIYGPPAWHTSVPSDEEYTAYFDTVLAEIDYPVAIAPNTNLGYPHSVDAVAHVCNKHAQVVAVNTVTQNDTFFIQLQDRLTRPVELYVPLPGSMNLLALGAAGLTGVEANILPRTYRLYLDSWERGDLTAAASAYADLRRFSHFAYVQNRQWGGRWVKMAMKAFGLPGGEGGMREPEILPGEAEIERFTSGCLELNIPEINDMARSAGLLS